MGRRNRHGRSRAHLREVSEDFERDWQDERDWRDERDEANVEEIADTGHQIAISPCRPKPKRSARICRLHRRKSRPLRRHAGRDGEPQASSFGYLQPRRYSALPGISPGF